MFKYGHMRNYVIDFLCLRHFGFSGLERSKVSLVVVWFSPDVGWYKVNTDEASREIRELQRLLERFELVMLVFWHVFPIFRYFLIF